MGVGGLCYKISFVHLDLGISCHSFLQILSMSDGDRIGQAMSGAWFPPDMMLKIEVTQFNFGFITPENFVSHNLRVFQTPSRLPCDFH